MKIEFTRQWCLRMAKLEEESASDMDVGFLQDDDSAPETKPSSEVMASPNHAFGRFVRLMRRREKLSLETLSEMVHVDISELVEIEEDARHVADPRAVYQLAQRFRIPTPKLMQLAGLSRPKDTRLSEEAIRFAARSEPSDDLNDAERAALNAFVSVLSERSESS